MMKVFLDGEFFAEWNGTLDDLADFSQVDVSRLSWDEDELRQKAIEARQRAYAAESDPLRVEADYDAIINGCEPDYTKWLARVREIKQRYPVPASPEPQAGK